MNNNINAITPINSNINFKATLKTPFKTGAMPEIADEFARITKRVKGTLEFDFASSELISSGLKSFTYNDVSYVTRDANKYLEMEEGSLSPKEIKIAAKKFADVLSALKVENAYLNKVDKYEIEIRDLERQVRINDAKKKRAEKHQLLPLSEVYAKNIAALKTSIEKKEAVLNQNEPAWHQTMIDKLDKYKGHELLDSYVGFVNRYYSK